MAKWRGFVRRISYSHTEFFDVEARTEEEAQEKIAEQEGSRLYRELDAEYELDQIQRLD